MTTISVMNNHVNMEFQEIRMLRAGVGLETAKAAVKNNGMDDVFVRLQNGSILIASGQHTNALLQDGLDQQIGVGKAVSISGDVGEVIYIDTELNTAGDRMSADKNYLLVGHGGGAAMFVGGAVATFAGVCPPLLGGLIVVVGIANMAGFSIYFDKRVEKYSPPRADFTKLDNLTWHQ